MERWIKEQAADLGFQDCGISRAERLDEEAHQLEEWLNRGYQGKMSYLERYFDMRVDPTRLVPGAKSVISLSYNYFPEQDIQRDDAPKIARYAYGRDYHKVLKKRLRDLWNRMTDKYGDISGRYFVDSGPVLERAWAERAGVGWRAKNTLLIHPRQGSYFFLAVIICDLDLVADEPLTDHCGRCRRCIDACPTGALSEEANILDASKCISYLTIELKEDIPQEFSRQMEDWMFGCDICQEVCPWNRFASPHSESDFIPREHVTEMSADDWRDLKEMNFEKIAAGTPLMRAGYKGIQRNLDFVRPHEDQS